jgi:tripartite-type tricarboxylate transporter receptor subunit TctC
MLANTGVMVINPALYGKLPYQTLRGLCPHWRAPPMQPLALVVHPRAGQQDGGRTGGATPSARPGQLNYGSAGNGGISHLVPEMFKAATGTVHRAHPVQGQRTGLHRPDGRPGAADGGIHAAGGAVTSRQGKAARPGRDQRRQRSVALPDTPTVIESGIKGFEVVGFYGFLAPANTPPDVSAKLSDAFKQVMALPDVRNRMITQGADPAFLGRDDFAKFLAAEMPKWAKAVQASGARVD